MVPSTASGSADDVNWPRPLLNRLPGLVGYWDRDQHNVLANDAFVDYWGLRPDEVRGRHLQEVVGDAIYRFHLPHVLAALEGREHTFGRTLIDSRGTTRHTQVSYIPQIVDGSVHGFYVVVTDVTDRVEAERASGEALRLFQTMVAYAPFGKAILTPSGHVLHINPSLCEVLGCTAEEVMGQDFRRFIHPDELPDAEAEMQQLISGAAARVSSVHRYVRADGTTIWMLRSAVLVRGDVPGEDLVVAQYDDATARKQAEAELARMAITDPLTGLPNRRAFEDWKHVHGGRDPDAPVGVVYVDLDGFKKINDTHGHATGDAILAEAARSLSRVVDSPSSAYRLGGDEFLVLMPVSDAAEVATLAETISRALTGRYGEDVSVTLTASVGWSHGTVANADQLLRNADAEMYRQKSRRLDRH